MAIIGFGGAQFMRFPYVEMYVIQPQKEKDKKKKEGARGIV